MYQIYIDSSDRYKKLVKLLKITNDVTEVVDIIEGDIDIVVEVKNLLERHNLKPSDINIFESNKGPGSFTGLKIGATVANIFNWALNKKSLKDLTYPEYGSEPNITPPKPTTL